MNMWKTLNKGIMKAFGMNIETDTATLNDESFLEWVGIKRDSESKKPTSDVTYFTCLKMMSETVAKMPWKLYQKTNKGISEPIDNDIARLMKQRPNPFMTPTTFWNAVEMNRNHYGNAYVYVRRKFKRKKYGGEYKALDMWIMPSDRVQIIIDDKGIFAGKGKIWYMYSDEYSGEQYIFRTEDVLHFKTSHCLNGIVGLPVQYILKQTVEGVIESQRFLNNLYKNGLKNVEVKSDGSNVSAYKYPIYMGDLKEAITLFDREKISIELSTEAGDLWAKDQTGIKVRDRFDVQAFDEEAVIKGEITVQVAG